jgi:hypothetical protein
MGLAARGLWGVRRTLPSADKPAASQGIVLASPKFGHSTLEMKLALQRSVQVAIPPRRPAGLVRRDPCGGIEMVTFGEDPARTEMAEGAT